MITFWPTKGPPPLKASRKSSEMSVSYETFAKTDNEAFQNKRFVRDIRKKRQRNLPKWAFRTRHSQKKTKKSSKMSVSYETFAKTDKETFQNERFVRDIRKNWQRDLPKWAFRTRHSQKRTRKTSKIMSVSYETFAKTDKETFQNERFVRDIRKILTKRPSKMSVSYETFAKTKISAFQCPKGTAYISHIRHARSPQRVDHAPAQTQFRLGFAHPTRTISAEGWPRSRTNAVSPRFRASDTHDLRRGLTTQRYNRSFA